MRRLWSLHLSRIPHHKDSRMVGMSTWPARSFCLCCFWQVVRHLWSLHMTGIPHHTDFHPGRNIYLTSWVILSVLFLTGREMSVVPTHVQDSPSHIPPPWEEHLPDQLVHSVCVVFDRSWDVCGPYMCLGSPITWIYTLVGMSTWPAGLFCLCCFWQAVRHLWSLHMSRIPHHMDLHPGRNVYLTSSFILSVLFFTDHEASLIPTSVRDPPSQGFHNGRNVYLTSWVILSVLFLLWQICGLYMCPKSPVTWTSSLVGASTLPARSFCLCCFWQIMRHLWSLHLSGIPHHKDSAIARMSTWPARLFCLCCFWQAARHLWSLHMSGIPHHMDLHPGRKIYLTSCFILSVLFLTDRDMSVVPTCVWDPPSHGPPPW